MLMAQEALIAYLLLAVVTALLAYGTAKVYRRTHQWSFVVGIGMLYSWTFAGAWFFIGDAASGYQGYKIGLGYYYLMEKMFPFELDACYLKSLCGYGVFTLLMLGAVLAVAGGKRKVRPVRTAELLRVDHRVFLLIALLAGVASFLIVRPLVQQAFREDTSVYLLTRATAFPGATLHALCNEIAAFSLLLGWALHLTADAPKYFGSVSHRWVRFAYPVLLVLFEVYLTLMGNKHELFVALVLGCLVYFVNRAGVADRRFIAYVAACAVPLFIIGKVREFSPRELVGTHQTPDTTPFQVGAIAHVPRSAVVEGPVMAMGRALLSNELFAAHFSLYGICRQQVEPVPGVSARYLAAAAVPRLVQQQRPPSAYDAYAQQAGLKAGQGYTIHCAAGWYMNGGWPVMLLGALLLGLAWGALLRVEDRALGRTLAGRTFAVMGASCWTAFLPMLVRAGPESFKALFFEGFMIPMGVVIIAAAVGKWSGSTERVNDAT